MDRGEVNSKKRPTGAVVSDLHLFTNRTTVHEHMPEIGVAADESEVFIFNGDIFDFQWSLYDGFRPSVHAAEKWIRQLAQRHPKTRLVFMLGNHDSIPEYISLLERLSRENPLIQWREQWYRLEDKIFLHGDIYHAEPGQTGIREFRQKCNAKLRHSRFRHSCYWAFARSGLPAFFLLFVRKKTCARRIWTYLASELGSDLDKVNHVYFGHVHTTFTNFCYRNLLFHNTGSATKGARLTVMRFTVGYANQDK
ncbi:MAG: metallophosphoesterase [Verrucomicrobiota bacterium]